MSRQTYKPAPAGVLLELLRATGSDAYRCHPTRDGQWTARCPLCGERRLDVHEHGRGGRVSLRCAIGCDPDQVLRVLTHPERCRMCGTDHGQVAALEQAAVELLALAHAQQRLLQDALSEDTHLELAA